MRIAFILPSLENTGPIIITKHLVDYLLKNNINVDIYYFKRTLNNVDFKTNTYKINLFSKINSSIYDIIHSTQFVPDFFLFFNKFHFKDKAIVSLHNFIDEDLRYLYNNFKYYFLSKTWKYILRNNNYYIVSSSIMKNYYINNYNISKRKIFIIPYGIQNMDFGEINNVDILLFNTLKNKYLILGSVGSVIHRKGFQQVLHFLSKNDKYAFVIIGNGNYYNELMNLANDYNLLNRFFVIGFRRNSYNYYKYFDIYVHASFSEGFGLAFLEAMAFGMPIVCSNLPIYNEYLNKSDVSFFDLNDLNSFTNAIIKATEYSETYKYNSKNTFYNKFSINNMGELHINLYTKIVDQKKYK